MAVDTAAFIAQCVEPAKANQRRYGVPASVTIAQAILESGWGRSDLATKASNYFGIKCSAQASPHQVGCVDRETWEHLNGNDVTVTASFRRYASMADSFLDHGLFLTSRPRYAAAFEPGLSADEFARRIHAAGYATDPAYPGKLIDLMDRYQLRQYDQPAKEGPTMPRIAISPSTQTWNAYTGIATNEQEQAYRQAEVFARILRDHGVEARIMTRGKGDAGNGYVKNAQESNATGPWDAHVCLHTDAGGATGTTGFHYPGDDEGRRLAQAIYDELAPISPGADHGVRSRSDLYELNSTSTHAVLMEAAPHDRAASARWIVDNPEAIGAAYARGTLRWLGIPYHNQPTNDVEDDIMSSAEAIELLKKIEGNTRWGADQLTPGKTGVKNTGETWAQLDAISRKLDALAKAQPGRDDAQDKAIAQLRADIEAKLAAAQVAFLAALDEIRAMLPGQEG